MKNEVQLEISEQVGFSCQVGDMEVSGLALLLLQRQEITSNSKIGFIVKIKQTVKGNHWVLHSQKTE